MQGFITTRHLVTQAPTIVGEFGFKLYMRCVWRCLLHPGRRTTFLALVAESAR